MSDYKLAFIGFGNVARSLARLLMRKQSVLERDYGITFSVTGIATGKHGYAVNPNELDLDRPSPSLEADSPSFPFLLSLCKIPYP